MAFNCMFGIVGLLLSDCVFVVDVVTVVFKSIAYYFVLRINFIVGFLFEFVMEFLSLVNHDVCVHCCFGCFRSVLESE